MKFDITFNDVIENGYYKIAKKIYDSGGVRMVIEINKIPFDISKKHIYFIIY